MQDASEHSNEVPWAAPHGYGVRADFRPTPAGKRTLDIVGAVCLLILTAPLWACTAVTIKFVSAGPIIFKHRRVGAMGRDFKMWKFRTMHAATDPEAHRAHVEKQMNGDGPVHKLNNDAQYIPFGKFLRRTCIDELPQLLNVLLGEMSLVGPRPDVLPLESYQSWQKKRFEVVPGMTGYWQVNGKNTTTPQQMMEMDVYYVEHRSLGMDLKILARTAAAIVRKMPEDD